MRSLLKGTIRDHRLPNDYKMGHIQPITSKAWWNNFKRYYMKTLINEIYASWPISKFCFLFFLMCPIWTAYRYYSTGSLPQALQPQHWLYRNSYVYHGHQQGFNQNPDNHYDRMKNCWTSDPNCGLDVGPKRPWEDLKDPSKNLVKFQRDMDENMHVKVNGWRGY